MTQQINSAGNIYCTYCHGWHPPSQHTLNLNAVTTQRIRDLERERSLREEAHVSDVSRARNEMLDWKERAERLEREVQRLKEVLVSMRQEMAALSEDWCVSGTESNRIREDRADAERFRWLAMRDDIDTLLFFAADIDETRAVIDAAMAKDPQL